MLPQITADTATHIPQPPMGRKVALVVEVSTLMTLLKAVRQDRR